MSVREVDYESDRGKQDAARHREKVKEAIKESLPDIIAEESIITKKDGKIVKVPIRGLKSYHFRHGGEGQGIGQGEGEEGDVIGRRPGRSRKPGEAGDQPGVDYIEAEVDIEELIDLMLEDLGLPNLHKKDAAQIPIFRGFKFDDIKKTGTKPNIAKKRTIKEGIKRTLIYVRELERMTGRSEDDCKRALNLSKGDFNVALGILFSNTILEGIEPVAPPVIQREDLRFKFPEDNVEYISNAVVLAMMDVSGSMDTMKKYLARSFYFWLVEFLKRLYERVEIKFIAHHTEAQIVDEDSFFHKGESGGTFCGSAYNLASDLVDAHYPVSQWNVYAFHFSDGEDYRPDDSVDAAKKLMSRGISMFGYGEIRIGGYVSSNLMPTFEKSLEVKRMSIGPNNVLVLEGESVPFLGALIQGKEDLWPVLKEFLKKERWIDGMR